MLRSLFLLFALGTLLLIGAANVGAQQTKPVPHRSAMKKKPAPGTPVSATAKRSSSTANATSGRSASATTTTDAGSRNDSDSPNTVNANGSIGSQETADGKGQGAYAAPGMLVKPGDSKHVGSYDGKASGAARTNKNGSTLKSSGSRP